MFGSPLNGNAVPCRGNGVGSKSWDRSAARARGSALSRDYRSTASSLGVPNPSNLVGNYSGLGSDGDVGPDFTGNSKRTPFTSVTKADYRAPSYGGYRNGYDGVFQPSVLDSYGRNYQPARNGESSSLGTKTVSSFQRSLPTAMKDKNQDTYPTEIPPKDLDFASPIEPRQFTWPTPKSVPDGSDVPSSADRAPHSKEEFFRNLKAEQAMKTSSMAAQDYGLTADSQCVGQTVDKANYRGPVVSSRPLHPEFTNFKSHHLENSEYPSNLNGGSQPSFQPYDSHPQGELKDYATRGEHCEFQERSIAEKPYESNPPPGAYSPGYTKAAVKSAAANAQPPVANYSVGPGYTDNKYAAGIVRPRYGAPSRDWPGLPVSDASYPKPEYKIPPPEAGLKKLTWKDEKEQSEITRLAPETQARYPGDAYKLPDEIFTASTYVPSTFEQQRNPEQIKAEYPFKADYDSQLRRPPSGKNRNGEEQESEYRPSIPTEVTGTKNLDNSESNALKGLKRIQTTNQTYGSWVDDPYIRGRDWWYKPTRYPLNKTFLSKFKEDAGVWS